MDFREKRRKKLLFELSNAADSSKEGISALRFQREKDFKTGDGALFILLKHRSRPRRMLDLYTQGTAGAFP